MKPVNLSVDERYGAKDIAAPTAGEVTSTGDSLALLALVFAPSGYQSAQR